MRETIDWQPARLRAVKDLTPDIRLFEIEPERFQPPTPGSNISIVVQVEGRPDTRSYSVVGPCTDGVYRIAVKLLPDSRGGSAYMHRLQPGARLTISAPGNHFELARHRPEYLLIAGGIGITPIYSMALALADAGAEFRLLYGCRTRRDLAFGEELATRLGERLQVFIDEEGGRVDLPAEIARLAPGGELYVCGPIGMLEAVKRAWQESGRPVDGLRFETFGNSGRYAAEPFTVRIPRLGKEVVVARTQSMLDALEAAGVDMIFDCRRGECGLCAVRILAADGTVDHRDVFFSEPQKAANTHLCTCVSRVVKGSITIDTADRTV
ncbi:PDR/VanB family oxidoreductase [Paracraurococcus lichenis]|uniref:PDR/VanB family oxidoreductase n=1 Tax=Paracraurococcus lichenis TaxID=3064888 RepID=A0ABT9E6S9_9PROT|nr:PDR/VanB family oxidoreductase [Paracraurococcus sp. LOR1-02]MDO9711887.1 PDR/VanB family oxidoreductase [Paracraurococcus sp. LOR1-02]